MKITETLLVLQPYKCGFLYTELQSHVPFRYAFVVEYPRKQSLKVVAARTKSRLFVLFFREELIIFPP